MFRCFLRWLAWRILDKEIREEWIHRGYLNNYGQWMSRDFPIMSDMVDQFENRPYGQVEVIRHRDEMEKKYFPERVAARQK